LPVRDNQLARRLRTRHIIFVLMALAVIIPLVTGLGLPLKVTAEVQNVFDFIDSLPAGSTIMFSFDHDTATLPEMAPIAEALLRHCYRNGIRVIGLALLAEGAAVGEDKLRRIGGEFGKKYGVDYLFLGFRPQVTVAMLGMGENIARVFPADYSGRDIMSFPIMNDVKNYDDVAAVISIADGDMPIYWINYAQVRYGVKLIPGVTAVMATTMYPFLQSKQLLGLVPGLRGAAEYEKLIDKPGRAVKGMDAQSTAHLLIIILIIAGNIGLIIGRRRKEL
jgi:hypothetical protein